MNKKIIKIILGSILTLNIGIAKADIYDMKSDYSDSVLKESTKKIDYTLKIYKDEKIIYSGNLLLDNSVITPIFYINDIGIKAEGLEMGEISDSKISGKKESKENISNEFQLRVAVHVGKNKENLWSQFFFQQIDADLKNSIAAVNPSNDKEQKKLKVEINPIANKLDKEIISAHRNGQESLISWNNYKFIFKAEIK